MVYGRDFAQLTLCFWDQGGGPGSLAKGERERGWGAYSGSCCLTTRKEQAEAAGMEPQAQAGQPRRGWAGAVRPGDPNSFWRLGMAPGARGRGG